MNNFRFKSASRDEEIVYGSERPGYPKESVGYGLVMDWIQFMKDRGIKRVCCLLTKAQLDYYDEDLLRIYRQEFGDDNLCWASVEDFYLSDVHTLTGKILPFLTDSVAKQEPVVVHCAGGMGRTGHVLAAWLVHGRCYGIEQALSEVKAMDRNPYEAVEEGTATIEQLYGLLRASRLNGRNDVAEISNGRK